MTYIGRVHNGVVVLDNGAKLPEGSVVRVEAAEPEPGRNSLADGLLGLAGSASGLPSDLASNHDHYLHGRPKR